MAIRWNELKHKNSPEKRAALKAETKVELEAIGFGKLRQARNLTQVALAERLDVPQAAISRMERRTDLLLSTLRQYVEGMGGQLELRATFPEGGEFLLDPLASSNSPATAKPPTSVAADGSKAIRRRLHRS